MRDLKKLKQAQHQWYLKNKDRVRRRKKQTREKRKEYVRKIKSIPCMDCKMLYPYYVMDLDHREGEKKEACINTIINRRTWEELVIEVKKCDVVCSNCHRVRTFKRSKASLSQLVDEVVSKTTA